ncbi:MAG: hypothetical protein AB2401_14510, partial [Bacillus sp. (in: firmicutes)]
MIKVIGAIVLTVIIAIGGYWGYQTYIENKAVETTKVQDESKPKDDYPSEIEEKEQQPVDSQEGNTPTGEDTSSADMKISEKHYKDMDFLQYP